jgi:hypothetical protein
VQREAAADAPAASAAVLQTSNGLGDDHPFTCTPMTLCMRLQPADSDHLL